LYLVRMYVSRGHFAAKRGQRGRRTNRRNKGPNPAKRRNVSQRGADGREDCRDFLCQAAERGNKGKNGNTCWHNFGTGGGQNGVFLHKVLVFKGFAAPQPSVYLSEKTEDTETDALSPRKRKNRAKMGKPSGAVPALPHLPKKQRWAVI